MLSGSGQMSACKRAFKEIKKLLVSAPVLTHYNPELPIRLAGDASAYDNGAIISHRFPDGTERSVTYASQTLTSTKRNYSQLEKEALALIYGVQKFYQYLYGRQFVLVTDHKPLTTILGRKRELPSLAVGTHFVCLFICYRIQTYKAACKC